MRIHTASLAVTVVSCALLSIGLKVSMVRLPDAISQSSTYKAMDIVLDQAGFVAVGWHRLTNTDAYVARVYRYSRPNRHCVGEVFVTAFPRNAEGVALVEALTKKRQGEVFYLLNGVVRKSYSSLAALWERTRTKFENILGRRWITTHFAVASTHTCRELRLVPWKLLQRTEPAATWFELPDAR